MTHHVPSYPGSPHEDHWPSYDPIGPHHHPKHPPYMIDRCADECDDQLPLFSQVGRGLQGEGYKVEVSYDDTDETYLTGYYHDPHTGADTLDWMSENINGGRLYYSYHIRNFTDPQTFTITFRYVRPNRDADEEGTVWSWTSPAIPYVGDEDMGDLIASWVSTLYLRKKGENWNWRQHEKLVYPEGMTHQSVNAPGPEEGWTVNLTYGIDEDCDIVVPTVEDLAKIIGMDPDEIYNLVKRGLPSDVIPDGMNVKQYIDGELAKVNRKYNVTSKKPGRLSVSSSTSGTNPETTTFQLDPKLPVAGLGIKVTEDDDGNTKISTNIKPGTGINFNIDERNNSITINNSQAGDNWEQLDPDTDFDWKWCNNWFAADTAQTETAQRTKPAKADQQPPIVEALISRDPDNNKITSAIIRVRCKNVNTNYLLNSKTLNAREWDPETESWRYTNFALKHGSSLASTPLSAIVSIQFKGEFSSLNDLGKVGTLPTSESGINVWNVQGTNDDIRSDSASWSRCGASWTVSCECVKANAAAEAEGFYKYTICATSIADGYNSQFSTPPYGYTNLCIRAFANFDWQFILG